MSAKKSTSGKNAEGFSKEEQAAMKERAKELKAEARASKSREEGEKDLLEKIAEMPESDRVLAARIHELVRESAPDLMPKTWYGMPAYARDGKVVCFFQGAARFEARYATIGFNDTAHLDDGVMWPVSFAVIEMTPEVEAKIRALVKQAVS